MSDAEHNQAAVIRDMAVANLADPLDLPEGHLSRAVVVPEGYALRDLRQLRSRLEVDLADAQSLVAYIERHRDEDRTVIFANEAMATFEVVFDGPPKGGPSEDHQPLHRARYKLQKSTDWQLLERYAGQPLTQEKFLEMLEDLEDIFAQPASGKIMEILREFHATKKVVLQRAVNLHDGSISIEYQEQVENGKRGEVTLPEELVFKLEQFKGLGVLDTVRAKLRFRVADGGVLFSIKIMRPDKLREAAVADVARIIQEGTGLPVLWVSG